MSALFGREREVAAVDRLLAEARARCAALVLEGEPGIGKTALWRAATRRAEEEGFGLLSCQPAQAEVKLSLASLADLLATVGDDVLSRLPEPQRLPLEVALLRATPGAARSDPRAVATALLSVLRHLTETSPVLVAIDDVQWLDRESAAALTFAFRRLDRARPVGLLTTVRSEPGAVPDVLGVNRHAAYRLERIRLGPLDSSALHRVLEAEVGVVLSRPSLQRLQQESGGNPLFAVELARALKDRGDRPRPGEPLPVPRELTELLMARVATLPPSAPDALLTVALLAQPTRAVIERALDSHAADGLECAWRAGLIEVRGERIRFVHPLYAAAVSSSVLPDKRRALHRRLADVVEDVEERARHLALASTEPDEQVARSLEEGAALARSRGAWGAAAELLERAGAVTPAHRRDAALARATAAAEHQLRAGDRPRSRELIEGVLAESPPGPLRAEALRLLAEISHSDDEAPAAQRLLQEALTHTDEPQLAGAIEVDLVYVNASLMKFQDGRRHAYRALELAEQSGDRSLAALALGHCAMMDFLCGGGVDWDKAEQSLAFEDPHAQLPLGQRPTTLEAFLLLYVGRHEEARQRLEALCAAASAAGDESDLAFLLLWRSWLATRVGDFPAAADLAQDSAAVAAVTGSSSMRAWALTQQALVHAHRGMIDETRRCCREATEPVRRSGNLLPHLWIAASLSLLELSLGNAEAAWQATELLTTSLEAQGVTEPVLAFFLPDALEALVVLGQLQRVEQLLAAFERQARELDRAWALATAERCLGLLLAARGDNAAALVALERALREHERIELPFERARTLLTRGVIERRSGQRARASASLGEARDEFERMGARLWADKAAAELRRVPIRRTAAAEALTPTQERMANLVARGRTNREIAQELFVTEKTVEANLTRIYRKLGLRSRAELVARITAHRPSEEGEVPVP